MIATNFLIKYQVMSNLKKSENRAMEGLSEDKLLEFLDVTGLALGMKEKEKRQFLEFAKAYKLNPFKREIYCSKHGDNLSIIVGYEVYLKRAEASGKLDGWEVEFSEDGKRAIITIHRTDWSKPLVHTVEYDEYVQKRKDGQVTKFWKEKPKTMLRKVAISQGFRLAFPVDLGGMPYTKEEINDIQDSDYQDVTKDKGPKQSNAAGPKTPPDADIPTQDEIETIKSIIQHKAFTEEQRASTLKRLETATSTEVQLWTKGLTDKVEAFEKKQTVNQ